MVFSRSGDFPAAPETVAPQLTAGMCRGQDKDALRAVALLDRSLARRGVCWLQLEPNSRGPISRGPQADRV